MLHRLGAFARLTSCCPKIHRLVKTVCNFWFCRVDANFESRCSLGNATASEWASLMKIKKPPSDCQPQIMIFNQPLSDCQPQIRHLDLSGVENMVESIALLREENDRLRRMAASLSAETEYIRRSLSRTKSPAPRVRALR